MVCKKTKTAWVTGRQIICICTGRKIQVLYRQNYMDRRGSQLYSCCPIGKTELSLDAVGPRNSTRAGNSKKSHQEKRLLHRPLKIEIY